MKKTLYTLAVDNYLPELCALTLPLLRLYADKIGADFHPITTRRFPEWPPVYEKLQIWDLGRENGSDWNIYFDADALVHPNLFDITELLPKDHVLTFNTDFAPERLVYDRFYRRYGRHILSGNWMIVASDWCHEIWERDPEITLDAALKMNRPLMCERLTGTDSAHLVDETFTSHNIAKYGLKYKSFVELTKQYGRENENYFWHQCLIPPTQKVIDARKVIQAWGIPTAFPGLYYKETIAPVTPADTIVSSGRIDDDCPSGETPQLEIR